MRARLAKWSNVIAYVGLLCAAVGLGVFLISRIFDLKAWVPLAVGALLLIVAALSKPEAVRKAVTGRTARYGSNALVMSLAVIAILGLVNFLGNMHHGRLDLTASKQYSLSQQTIQVLEGLTEPVKITAFMTASDSYYGTLKDLLTEYQYHSDKLSVEFVDPDLKPAVARQYGITSYGTIVFERGDRRQDIFGVEESDITGAILKVSSDTQKTVYFITGHKERDPGGTTQDAYSAIKAALEQNNYTASTLNLATTSAVPDDAAAVIVAGPQVAYAQEELTALSDYLNGGGKMMILEDPGTPADVNSILEPYGLAFQNDIVVDPSASFFGDALTPLTNSYPYSPITKDMGGLTSFFPYVRSITRTDTSDSSVTVTNLIETSDQAWGETNLQQQQVSRDDADNPGPLTLAMQVEKGSTRLVLIGDSDFAGDNVLYSVRGAFGNSDLFINSVNWLAEEEQLIAIGPKPADFRQIILTPSEMRFILYTSAIGLPLVVLAAGAAVWLKRR